MKSVPHELHFQSDHPLVDRTGIRRKVAHEREQPCFRVLRDAQAGRERDKPRKAEHISNTDCRIDNYTEAAAGGERLEWRAIMQKIQERHDFAAERRKRNIERWFPRPERHPSTGFWLFDRA
jgi:hypothetical protein